MQHAFYQMKNKAQRHVHTCTKDSKDTEMNHAVVSNKLKIKPLIAENS